MEQWEPGTYKVDAACPACHRPNDAARSIGPGCAAPAPDDVSICIHCGLLSVFEAKGESLTLRIVSDEEFSSWAIEDKRTASRALDAVHQLLRRRGARQ